MISAWPFLRLIMNPGSQELTQNFSLQEFGVIGELLSSPKNNKALP